MTPFERYKQLGAIVETKLCPLINNDYILIDLPYHSNIGDILIWAGEEQLLNKLTYKCLYRCSYNTFEYKNLSKNTLILMHGGGNLGDTWELEQDFRLKIIQLYPNNPIIQLPQTVYYHNVRRAGADAYLFSKHKNLTIYARDKYSYYFLKRFGFSKNIILSPDMAFCISYDAIKNYVSKEQDKTLLVKRTDKEINESLDLDKLIGESSKYEVHDWPTFEHGNKFLDNLNSLIIQAKKNGTYSNCHKYALAVLMPNLIKTGIEFVSSYNKIYTTRLHVAILSVILGKKVNIIDNSYGKNSQFYNTWLKETSGIVCLAYNKRTFLQNFKRSIDYMKAYFDLYRMRFGLGTKLRTMFRRSNM